MFVQRRRLIKVCAHTLHFELRDVCAVSAAFNGLQRKIRDNVTPTRRSRNICVVHTFIERLHSTNASVKALLYHPLCPLAIYFRHFYGFYKVEPLDSRLFTVETYHHG